MPSAPKWLFDTVEFLTSKLPLVKVAETEFLSPTIKKIRFNGDFKKLNFSVGAYIDFRVSDTEVRRYTASYINPEKGILEIIAHLHGKGCGSDFIDSLKVGDNIILNAPRAFSKYYNKTLEQFVIFGDETSLGLARSFMPVLKRNKHKFQFIFELEEENKNVPELLGLENCLVFPKNNSFRNEQWISNLPVIKTLERQEAYFVLTGNVKSAQTFRKVIRNKTNGKVYLHGYWLEGKKGL